MSTPNGIACGSLREGVYNGREISIMPAYKLRGTMNLVHTETRRVLIIAKTYPELSTKYGETVCTAAVDEEGNPLRLYPIPFRYLKGPQRFERYQWVSLGLSKNPHDVRPESYRVDPDSISLGATISATPDEWGKRAEVVFKLQRWQYSSMNEVIRAQREHSYSLAFVRPLMIDGVSARRRTVLDAETFEQKLQRLKEHNSNARMQLKLFANTMPPKMKHLEFMGERVCVDWRCADQGCPSHSMQILDWEICELARRNGLEAARNKVRALVNSERYRTAFFLGNFHMYPGSFAIIGLWYPRRANRLF
jgi:hypothetical protein